MQRSSGGLHDCVASCSTIYGVGTSWHKGSAHFDLHTLALIAPFILGQREPHIRTYPGAGMPKPHRLPRGFQGRLAKFWPTSVLSATSCMIARGSQSRARPLAREAPPGYERLLHAVVTATWRQAVRTFLLGIAGTSKLQNSIHSERLHLIKADETFALVSKVQFWGSQLVPDATACG